MECVCYFMARNICFLLLISNIFIQATVIDPQAANASSKIYYQCLYSKTPLQIKDPFNRSEIESPKFISMDWHKTRDDKEDTLIVVGKTSKTVLHPAVSIFEYWGLQINNITIDTDGNYTAKLIRLSTNKQIPLHITIAVPPVLTKQLTIVRDTNGNSVTVSCGPIVSLGDPPVTILFKDGSGHVLYSASRISFGFAKMTHTATGPAVDSCELDWSSPAASCVADRSQWRTAYNKQSVGTHPMDCLWTRLIVLLTAVVQMFSLVR